VFLIQLLVNLSLNNALLPILVPAYTGTKDKPGIKLRLSIFPQRNVVQKLDGLAASFKKPYQSLFA